MLGLRVMPCRGFTFLRRFHMKMLCLCAGKSKGGVVMSRAPVPTVTRSAELRKWSGQILPGYAPLCPTAESQSLSDPGGSYLPPSNMHALMWPAALEAHGRQSGRGRGRPISPRAQWNSLIHCGPNTRRDCRPAGSTWPRAVVVGIAPCSSSAV